MDNKKSLPMSAISIIVVMVLAVVAVACAVFFSKKKDDDSFKKTTDEAIVTGAVSNTVINTDINNVTQVVTAQVQDEIEMDETGRYRTLKSIKGAQVIENPQAGYYGGVDIDYNPPYEYMQMLKKTEMIVAYGSISNALTVSVEDKDEIWYISTFDLKVLDAVKNCQDLDEIKVIAVAPFDKNRAEYDVLGNFYPSDTNGIVLLNKLKGEDDRIINVGEDIIKPLEYADYYFSWYYPSDGRQFVTDGYIYPILFDDIRDGVDERYKLLPDGGNITGLTITLYKEKGYYNSIKYDEYECTTTDKNIIQKIRDYLDSLKLDHVYTFTETDLEKRGWTLEFSYSDRESISVNQYGNERIKNEAGIVRAMDAEQGIKLQEILAEIDEKLLTGS